MSQSTATDKPFRPCANCTCSPGLLSRQKRRSSLFIKQVERRRSSGKLTSSQESLYSSDTLCANNRNVNTTERLQSLRSKMKQNDLCVYIVPSEDEHNSEYVAAADQRRAFISGFTGSAGVAIITRDVLNFNETEEGKSALSTDGRYFNQAAQELDFNWQLLRQGEGITWQEWAVQEAIEYSLGSGKTTKIGIDPKLISYSAVESFQKLIAKKLEDSKATVELVPVVENLVDAIWGDFEKVPERESSELLYLKDQYSGEEYASKLAKLQEHLTKNHADSIVITALDEVAWFLNLRGADIQYNPVFYSYVIVDKSGSTLFTNNPCNEEVSKYLADNKIVVKKYEEVWEVLETSAKALSTEGLVLLTTTASWAVVHQLQAVKHKQVASPVEVLKSVKNSVEIGNAREAQIKDAVCLSQYFSWLEDQLVNKGALIDEYKAGLKLLEIRKTQEHFMGNSFETISSTGSNAAIIHYGPEEGSCAMIDPSKIYLCDSGCQFLEGTTDITRTLHFGTPTQEEIDNYTLVLKGNLALERLVFPEGTNGYAIDVIARQFLWSRGLDYRHGTGHGIGQFLNVHEGPMGIGFRPDLLENPLVVGNIISNEPGYYEDGKYGIRIENDILVKKAEGLSFGDKGFLKFENITLVPYCKKLINVQLLSVEDKEHINTFNKQVWDTVSPLLESGSIAHTWLKRETSPI